MLSIMVLQAFLLMLLLGEGNEIFKSERCVCWDVDTPNYGGADRDDLFNRIN